RYWRRTHRISQRPRESLTSAPPPYCGFIQYRSEPVNSSDRRNSASKMRGRRSHESLHARASAKPSLGGMGARVVDGPDRTGDSFASTERAEPHWGTRGHPATTAAALEPRTERGRAGTDHARRSSGLFVARDGSAFEASAFHDQSGTEAQRRSAALQWD